ncbi:MAG: helix-turn-helix domain-containing protein [Lacrimispora sp.]|uniref:TetR/AcrR family transcriptional regulator n=1 Tax=Lacrimispora sp. TaxID=2719234 RepID=UPI0039E258DE
MKEETNVKQDINMEERLLDAARKLLKEGGYARLTIRRVCMEADCSTSTFYQYFDSKDDLLASFIQRNSFKKSSQDDYLNFTHPEAIIEIYLQTARYLSSLPSDVLHNYLTPGNLALNARTISQTKGNGWVMDLVWEHFRKAQSESMFLPGHDYMDIYSEMDVILFGYLFHWAVYAGEYDLIPPMRKMMIERLNIYLMPEHRLSL